MTKHERAKAYADRHEQAEADLRGLSGVYAYQRIYNAELTAHERGAEEQEERDKEIIKDFLRKLTENIQPMDPKIQEIVNEHFWEML